MLQKTDAMSNNALVIFNKDNSSHVGKNHSNMIK